MLTVHTYYTSGMHELALVFVESFAEFHKDHDPPITLIIDAAGVDTDMISDFDGMYPNLIIQKKSLPLAYWAGEAGISTATLENWRFQVEHGYVNEENKLWKLLTAGQLRIECVKDLLDTMLLKDDYSEMLVHFDIDTLFRSDISCIEEEMKGFDVGLKLRPKIQPVKARITIDMVAFNINYTVYKFVFDWLNRVKRKQLRYRQIGFGQSTCWEAWEKASSEGMSSLTLPLKYGLPGRNMPDDAIWCGNVHRLKKDDCAEMFAEELKRLKEDRT